MKITMGGKEITFDQYLKDSAGSGLIYERDIESIVKDWESANWIQVDDYIAPIVSQLIVDASEMNRDVYTKLMHSVIEAYDILKRELGQRPKLTRIK